MIQNKKQNQIALFLPSAKIFPLNPRSNEIYSSGSLTTLHVTNKSKLKYNKRRSGQFYTKSKKICKSLPHVVSK